MINSLNNSLTLAEKIQLAHKMKIFSFFFLILAHTYAGKNDEISESITALYEELLDLKSTLTKLYEDHANLNPIKGGGDDPLAQMRAREDMEIARTMKLKVEEAQRRYENYLQLGRRGEPDRDVSGSSQTYVVQEAGHRAALKSLEDSETVAEGAKIGIEGTMAETKENIELVMQQITDLSFNRVGIEVSSSGRKR